MNCKFCNQDCSVVYVTDTYKYHNCYHCNAEFRPGNTMNLHFEYNNKKYYYQERGSISCPARFVPIMGMEIIDLKSVIKNISPQNVKDKFKLFAIFS